jgi:hypothetical protein
MMAPDIFVVLCFLWHFASRVRLFTGLQPGEETLTMLGNRFNGFLDE